MVDCTHIGSVTASLKNLKHCTGEHYSRWGSVQHDNSWPGAWLYKPNSWTKSESLVVVWIINVVSAVLNTFTGSFFVCLFLLPWIKKWSSHGHLLEHLESSGTKIMMRWPIVHQMCRNKLWWISHFPLGPCLPQLPMFFFCVCCRFSIQSIQGTLRILLKLLGS